MILDSFDYAERYSLSVTGLREAVEFARGAAALAAGRYELSHGAYALVQEYETLVPGALKWEAHRVYADVQVMLEGRERIGWAVNLDGAGPYDEAKDVILAPGATGASELELAPGLFSLFLPGEPHRPKACAGTPARVRKLVVKLPVMSGP
jgi:biofilm protein TabA